ncbi:MAG: hypothetical protein AAGD43_11635 [Pseudomonadota bacterium]
MTDSKTYLEKVQTKLGAVTAREKVLIQALGEALGEADRCLLDDVRALTIEHETRRAMILSELQNLASRIGTFPAGEREMEALDYEPLDLPYKAIGEAEQVRAEPKVVNEKVGPPAIPETMQAEVEKSGGDWREALANLRKAG